MTLNEVETRDAATSTSHLDLRGLEALARPRGIAIIGASSDPTKIGGRPLRFVKESGFQGGIYPINPRYDEVQGVRAYASLEDVDGPVDLAVVAVPRDHVLDAIRACGRHGVQVATVFSGGFGETDEAGAELQRELIETARAAGVRVLGPNTIGSMNRSTGAVGTFAAAVGVPVTRPVVGRAGLVSQSGAVAAHWVVEALELGLDLGTWIATGNEGDVDFADALALLALDDEVPVIAAYMEGCRNGDKLREALAIAQDQGKPVVLLKVGTSEVGARAAASHTASLVGSDQVFDALFEQYNVLRAESMAELLDLTYALTVGKLPTGNRAGLFTASGGMGILMADRAAQAGLEVPPVPAGRQAELKAIWPPAGVNNPIDMTAQVMNSRTLLGDFADVVLREGDYDCLVMALSYMGQLEPWTDLVVEALTRVRADHPETPLFVSMLATPEVRQAVEQLGITVFRDVNEAVAVAGRLARYALRRTHRREVVVPVLEAPTLQAGQVLTEVEAKAVLAAAGVPVVPERVVRSAEEAAAAATALGLPVAMKIVSPDIVHKTEIGGVALGLASAAEAADAYTRIDAAARSAFPAARIDGVLVAPMVPDGVETILGAFNDPTFGPVVMFGLGGVFVEVLKDVRYRLAPFDEQSAAEMIREIRGFAILDGARGKPPVDLDALAAALSALSRFAAAHRDVLDSVDVNPFLARPRGYGGVAVDALVTVRPPA